VLLIDHETASCTCWRNSATGRALRHGACATFMARICLTERGWELRVFRQARGAPDGFRDLENYLYVDREQKLTDLRGRRVLQAIGEYSAASLASRSSPSMDVPPGLQVSGGAMLQNLHDGNRYRRITPLCPEATGPRCVSVTAAPTRTGSRWRSSTTTLPVGRGGLYLVLPDRLM